MTEKVKKKLGLVGVKKSDNIRCFATRALPGRQAALWFMEATIFMKLFQRTSNLFIFQWFPRFQESLLTDGG